MTKTNVDMSDAAKRDRLSINLQKEILAAQSAQSGLIEEVRELKTQLASFETWDTEKRRYKLCKIGAIAFTYLLKKDSAFGEPPHWLCTNCYEQKQKHFLQYKQQGPPRRDSHKAIWACSHCNSAILVDIAVKPEFQDGTEAE